MDGGQSAARRHHKFPDGQFFEENALFRQEPELIQEKWSWKELKDGKPQREFAADFLAGTANAHIQKDNKDVTEKIDIAPGQTFAGFGFTIALGNLRPRLLKGEQNRAQSGGLSKCNPNIRIVSSHEVTRRNRASHSRHC